MRDRDEAMSPVIGTILMVAISVVLAGVAFTLFFGIGKHTDSSPPLQFYRDQNSGTLTVSKVGPGVPRVDIEIRVSIPVRMGYNGPASAGVLIPAGAFTPVEATTADVRAGDTLAFCGEGGPVSNLQVSFRHEAAPTALLYTNSFTFLKAC
ncbi:MAG: type IV pilin [Thermoplasmatota archaeon]